MERHFEQITNWLICALAQISNVYFQLPVAGSEELEYRERVYCYELYHRWRMHWPDNFPFILGGEVDKNGHPLIRNKSKPDFLVHRPGEMSNLLIMWVKPSNADINKILEDLEKMTWFRRNLNNNNINHNYFSTYLWIYGLNFENWFKVKNKILNILNCNPNIYTELIKCFIHQSAGSSAISVNC